ncbi:hypothetical protein [Mycobacterium noviomagense]|uniref:hypothetical protein n=1 Tax=Mycobacterium noviomagense TaxID=459858 RepID=UPI001E4D64A3|nr:hypothetical protein [Mycobacterium noviomagense]
MTGPAQIARAAGPPPPGQVNGSPMPPRQTEPPARRPLAALGGRRALGWLSCGVAGCIAICWFIFFSPGQSGSKADWFFGAVVFGVVLVAIWQTVTIQRQAAQHMAEAAEHLRKEFIAAEERAAREVAITRRLHQEEMEAQQSLHRAQMEAQRELARVERGHLLKLLQKQAMIEVSRAVGSHTQMLATLWNEAARVLRIEDREERELAMNPIFERISQVVNDFSVEISNAHLLVDDNRLHQALHRVNEAALMAVQVAEDLHVAVVDGHAPEPNPIPPVRQLMLNRAAEARHLAWELLRTGLDDGAAANTV